MKKQGKGGIFFDNFLPKSIKRKTSGYKKSRITSGVTRDFYDSKIIN